MAAEKSDFQRPGNAAMRRRHVLNGRPIGHLEGRLVGKLQFPGRYCLLAGGGLQAKCLRAGP
jgi:hypothetical protein